MTLEFLRDSGNRHVSVYQTSALERAWEGRGVIPLTIDQSQSFQFVAKCISKLRLTRRLSGDGNPPILVAMMGYSESRLFPKCLHREFIPYVFDCWPSSYDRWESFFWRNKIRMAIFSARQSASYFAKRMRGMQCIWLPEALDVSDYSSGPNLVSRDIDVLELGRKFDWYHQAILEPLSQAERIHLFERVKGQIVFPTLQEFVDGLSRSKVSVCFPCSMTHPERSGDVETVTMRYFESIASRCLIVGKCPAELQELFGYNPIIEIDTQKPSSQILEILTEIDKYQEFVDSNRARLLQVGTWDVRVSEMLETIQSRLASN